MINVSASATIRKQALRPVKCPKCGRGRVCDATEAYTLERPPCRQIKEENAPKSVIIKCPVCGASVVLTLH